MSMTLEQVIMFATLADRFYLDELMSEPPYMVAWIDGDGYDVYFEYNNFGDHLEFESARLYRQPDPNGRTMAERGDDLNFEQLCAWVEQ